MSSNKLRTLAALIEAAAAVADEMASLSESTLGRLTRLFARMPDEDREPILAILEHEVNLRLYARTADQTLSGFEIGPPNPHARIYARLFGRQQPAENRDKLMLGVLRALRMMVQVPPDIREAWEETTLEAFRELEPAERAVIARLNRQMLALLEQVDRETGAKAS
jgi:hypothetical protein